MVAFGPTVGLDVGGTKIHGVLLDATGRVLDSVRLVTVPGPAGVIRSTAEAVDRLIGPAGAGRIAVDGVGVGVPGLVDPVAGSVMHAVNVGIDGRPFPLAARLGAALGGVPVTVDNDLNVAAVGASHALGPDGRDLAFLALGTGVAAGIVLAGRLYRGARGAAGEIGHLPMDPNGPVCGCGQRGCIEAYASGWAIAGRWPGEPGLPAPARLFAAAAAGDERAVRIKAQMVDAVAAAVRILGLTVDVPRIVLGGGISRLGVDLLDAVRESLEHQARTSQFLASLRLADRVSLAPAGVPVAAVGAALASRRKVS